MAMKHVLYEDGEEMEKKVGDYTATIRLNAVGVTPRLVQADWFLTNGRKGTAFGGFQRTTDFDFQTAAACAVENAVAQIGGVA